MVIDHGQVTQVTPTGLPHSDKSLNLGDMGNAHVSVFQIPQSLQPSSHNRLDLSRRLIIPLGDILLFDFKNEVNFVDDFKFGLIPFFPEIIPDTVGHVDSIVIFGPVHQLFGAVILPHFHV